MTSGRRNGSFTRVRIIGIGVVLGLLVFVTVIDVLDGLFFSDSYHVDASFYTLLAGLVVAFLGGEAISILGGRAQSGRDEDER